jgi:ABC-type nitrate/sulfonate/bicarbonate transport system ATPase subunit
LSSRVMVMTRQPGAICATYEIPFGYPRDYGLTLTDTFVALKREIYAHLGVRPADAAMAVRRA